MGREMSPPRDETEDNASAGSPHALKAIEGVKNVEDLMQKLTTSSVTKASPTVKKVTKTEEDDCLEEAGKEKKKQTQYQVRKAVETKKGFTFGALNRAKNNQYHSPDLSNNFLAGRDSPGPIYTPASFTDHPVLAQSFPKGPRSSGKPEGVPGPQYDIPGSLGRQLTRETAPTTKFGQASRFIEGEFISHEHSKGATSLDSPAPNMYSPEIPETGPAFSFSSGGRDLRQGKLFLSREHAEHEGVGLNSPGPIYTWSADLVQKRGPTFSFGPGTLSPLKSPKSPHGSADGTKGPTSPRPTSALRDVPGLDSPGPGMYSPSRTVLEPSAPAFSFGIQETTTKRFLSRELIQLGQESPGPQYKPSEKQVKVADKAPVFACKDPVIASTMPRFSEKQFLGSQLAQVEMAGKASPGPAAYDPLKPAASPAYTMAKKEKVLMKRISPGPERARYLSGELAKENIGSFSPGPKYKMPDTIGTQHSLKFSFGRSDRAYDDIAIELKEKLGTIDKPYTAPCEARFFSVELQREQMMGKCSPGPKYTPKFHLVDKRPPAHPLGGKWKTKDVPKATKEEVEEELKKVKARHGGPDITEPNPPSIRFGTSKRGADEARIRVVGKDSPGPVYCPNFEAVSRKTPAPSLGGLH
eukprot:GGOE01057114.1.p1 GENE.GGOE01057114.1~~GGOE01057114.1.p1  ORF type:complete len:639 (+),score=162.00 GGOE01057114.1:82-1998(+)